MQPIVYIDRETGEKVVESVMGDKALRFAYETLLGRTLWPVLFGSKCISALMGSRYDSPRSRKDIAKLDEVLNLTAERKAAIRTAALDSVRTNFSTDRMCAETIALYRSLDAGV